MKTHAIIFVVLFAIIGHALTYRIDPDSCTHDNEHWLSCGTKCPETCLNRHLKNRACVKMCSMGCFCKPGFIRQGYDMMGGLGSCVTVDECDLM